MGRADDLISSELITIMAIGAVMLYVSSRFAAQVLGGTMGRAVGHFIPIIFTAMIAAAAGHDSLAINLLFAATVMIVTLVIGVSILSAPMSAARFRPRTWSLFLPVAALAWMAGALAVIDTRVAVSLFCVGALIAWSSATGAHSGAQSSPRLRWWMLILLLSVVVAVFGAAAANFASQIVLSYGRSLTEGILASTIIAPLLVLPVLGSASESAISDGSCDHAVSVCVSTALLNLCFGLPAIAAVRFAREKLLKTGASIAFPIPYGIWRLDSMVLVVVGLLLLPIGLGRWTPSRLEGLLLIIIYVMYLYMVSPLAKV